MRGLGGRVLLRIANRKVYAQPALRQSRRMSRSREGRILSLLLLPTAAGACGDEASRSKALADNVARDYRRNCEGSPAPDAAMRRHLLALCACSEARIRATRFGFGDSDSAIGEKVRIASEACLAELGGAPGEGRR